MAFRVRPIISISRQICRIGILFAFAISSATSHRPDLFEAITLGHQVKPSADQLETRVSNKDDLTAEKKSGSLLENPGARPSYVAPIEMWPKIGDPKMVDSWLYDKSRAYRVLSVFRRNWPVTDHTRERTVRTAGNVFKDLQHRTTPKPGNDARAGGHGLHKIVLYYSAVQKDHDKKFEAIMDHCDEALNRGEHKREEGKDRAEMRGIEGKVFQTPLWYRAVDPFNMPTVKLYLHFEHWHDGETEDKWYGIGSKYSQFTPGDQDVNPIGPGTTMGGSKPEQDDHARCAQGLARIQMRGYFTERIALHLFIEEQVDKTHGYEYKSNHEDKPRKWKPGYFPIDAEGSDSSMKLDEHYWWNVSDLFMGWFADTVVEAHGGGEFVYDFTFSDKGGPAAGRLFTPSPQRPTAHNLFIYRESESDPPGMDHRQEPGESFKKDKDSRRPGTGWSEIAAVSSDQPDSN